MICALLVFQTAELPAPLAEISPWLDWLGAPRDELFRRLEAQDHRRLVKTHTPLDGIPLDPRAVYIVVARDPLDLAVSLYHQGDNLDRKRVRELTGQLERSEPPAARPTLREWLLAWIDSDADPRDAMDSLRGVMAHASDAWARRGEPNVILVHYDDLAADLDGSMRALAARLKITVPEATWPELVDAAGFERMRARAPQLAPDAAGVLKDRAAFFRRGSSGAAREVLSSVELQHYRDRTQAMTTPDLWTWLHRDDFQT
jgi:hypothetical protein